MIYIMVFLSSVFFAYLADKSKNKGIIILCSVISILIPSILGGLRDSRCGTDVRGYALTLSIAAEKAKSFTDFLQNRGTEPGFLFVCYFAMQIFGHLNWTLFFYQLITMSCVYIGLYKHKKSISLPFALLVFFFMQYNRTYNIMRQCLAASVMFMGLNNLEEKKYFTFLLYILAAMLFHNSSIEAILLFIGLHVVVTSKVFNEKFYFRFILIVSIFIAIFFMKSIMMLFFSHVNLEGISKYIKYFSRDTSKFRARFSMLLLLSGQLIMFVFYQKGAKRSFVATNVEYNNVNFYQFNVLLMLFCELVFDFFDREMFERFFIYSSFLLTLSIASLPSFVKNKYLKLTVGIAIIATIMVYWFKTYSPAPGSSFIRGPHETWPYISIL